MSRLSPKDRFTTEGALCSKGHEALFYVSDGSCVGCRQAYAKARTAAKYGPDADARETARAEGKNTFIPGYACIRGHLSERYVRGGNCVECNKEKARRATKENQGKNRLRVLQGSHRRRGYPQPTYAAGAHCEICQTAFSDGKNVPHLDHCHETNQFRGWLCGKCNRGLGLLGDTLQSVRAAYEYLERKAA